MGARFIPRPKAINGFLPSSNPQRLYKNPSYQAGLRLFRIIHDTLLKSDKPCIINKPDKFPSLTPMSPEPEDPFIDFFATDIVIPLYPRNSNNIIPTTHLQIRLFASIDRPSEPVKIAYAYPPICHHLDDLIKPKPKRKYNPRLSHSLHAGMSSERLKTMLRIEDP